jgi:DEAD/DEAH box helicase domain-containing protein
MHFATFDLETRKLAADLPDGWAALKRGEGGISCLAAWSSLSGRPHLFGENTLQDAGALLEEADCVLSFNGVRFDIPVLEGVLGRSLAIKHHLDMLQMVWAALSERGENHKGNSLGELAYRTLGTSKNGNGLLAPQLADEGRWAELHDYCLQDVHLTRNLFKFAQKHGGVIDSRDEMLLLTMPDWFKEAEI